MASKTAVKLRKEEQEFELPVSMNDVVFLLLIFFMCSMKFRTVEKKLDAELPKDEGQNPIPTKVEQPTEIRVQINWANSAGQVIHSPNRAFPRDWPGVVLDLSLANPHIELKVNRLRVKDLHELTQTLADLNARNPMPVVLDARAAVPFRWVIGALDACARAKVENVKFQSPPAPEGGGGDWWWM